MRIRSRFVLGVVALLVMLGVGISHLTRPVTAPEHSMKIASRSPNSPTQETPLPTETADRKASVEAGRAVTTESKATKVVRLLATGSPEDAFSAWSVLATCNDRRRLEQEARSNVRSGPPEWLAERARDLASGELARASREACEDLSPTQIGDRLKYLERAAAAGVPHAALGLMREGPWGDPSAMYSRWDDPAVQAWLARSLELLKIAAAKGDLDTLDALAQLHQYGGALVKQPDPAAALMYATAYNIAYKRHYGRDMSPNRQRALESLVARLPAEQVEKERAAAVQLLGEK